MEQWKMLRVKMEETLQGSKLAEALGHLDALIRSASGVPNFLIANKTVRALPILHHLAYLPFQERSMPHLEKLIEILTNSGYDINKTAPDYYPYRREVEFGFNFPFYGFTALLASVEHRNVIVLECLLRQGARADIRDKFGCSPCHWAIKVGDLKCLEKLVEFGGASVLASSNIEKCGMRNIHPLLHTAVDLDRSEIVSYLLSLEELGVDVNEKAKYRNGVFTALARALEKLKLGNQPIVELLMRHPGTTPSLFLELDSCLEEGNTVWAFTLLKYFSCEELSSHKIGDKWALHCLHPSAFLDIVMFTKKVILEYVGRGWDANSVSNTTIMCSGLSCSKYTLLHLTCMAKARQITKVLVEKVGVNLNCKTEGELELTPLHISIMEEDWKSAGYLIDKGADLNARGSKPDFCNVLRRNLTTGSLELDSTFNSVELLVRMGCEEGLPLLDKVLASPDVIWHGGNELHLALEGKKLTYILKVLQRCAKIISKEDLNWITVSRMDDLTNSPEVVPPLVWLLENMALPQPQLKDVETLAELVKLFAQLGYNLNNCSRLLVCGFSIREPLIFQLLSFASVNNTSNRLLRTILQFDHLQLNLRGQHGQNPVEHLLHEWNTCCNHRTKSPCKKIRGEEPLPILEAVNLLVTHGLDLSQFTIGRFFIFHRGFEVVFKMLCRAGANVSNELLSNVHVCQFFPGGANAAAIEIGELNTWKDKFDRETRFSLKHICGLRVRKMLKCVGDLKMLDVLRKDLKDEVLGWLKG